MSAFISEFSDSIIKANSKSSFDQNELWSGFFDFALLGASWDKRCTAITKCHELQFHTAVEIVPFEMTSNGSLDTHQQSISDFCLTNSKSFHVTQSKTANLAETLADVRTHFWSAISGQHRSEPARVFIDVTTCPRYFSLAVLVEAFRSGLVGEIVVAYSEGGYPDAAPSYEDMEEISFTDGAFQSVPVPGFFGEFEPKKGVFFLVSTGFDGWKTLNLLVRKDPERVAALVASPGVRPDYEQRALVANSALFKRFGIGDELVIKAPAGDAIQAWRRISEANLEDFENDNVYYLCSGNKAHSVALALRAIVKNTPTLLYNRPTKHLPSDIDCSGVYWAYSIKPTAGTVFG